MQTLALVLSVSLAAQAAQAAQTASIPPLSFAVRTPAALAKPSFAASLQDAGLRPDAKALDFIRGAASAMLSEGPVTAAPVPGGLALIPAPADGHGELALFVPLGADGVMGQAEWTPLNTLSKALVSAPAAFDGSAATPAQEPSVLVPDQMVADGIPAIPQSLAAEVGRYLEMRGASFSGWHPKKREMLILTRFADTAQIHAVKRPGGDRRQLSFLKEPVAGARYSPKTGEYILYSQDTGGSEFHQLYRLDLVTGRSTLLTDGKSRNRGAAFSRGGKLLAYTSTRRNGKDADIYVMDPSAPQKTRLVMEADSGNWGIDGWSRDNKTLLVEKYISINESRLFLVDVKTGQKKLLAPADGQRVSYSEAHFARGGKYAYATSNRGSEFKRLVRIDLATGQETPIVPGEPRWDVEEYAVSHDGRKIAYVSNEDGAGVLRVIDAATGKQLLAPKLPLGTLGGLSWHKNGRDLAFTMSSAGSASDVYSLNVKTSKLSRWTASETGGIDAGQFREPELVRFKSFDGVEISGFLYRPDPKRFPGKRPVVIKVHGGPEGQSRPGFLGRENYYLNELGVALFFPNVRGSEGYGKTFLDLDNGFKREDSVKDLGAAIDRLAADPALDAQRIAVMGGSYGGYMTLAALVHFSDKLVGGVDMVGISNFVTFLENTQEYRRDARRAEYGDERDPAMREFLQRISPLNNVDKITKPLFVGQGQNDPRVPVGEAEQIVKAVRAAGREAWYLLAKDEGHGFAKKKNADFYFLAVIVFLSRLLLPKKPEVS